MSRPHAQPPYAPDRRAPAMECVLQQEAGHRRRQHEPAPVMARRKTDTGQADRRRIGLEHALHIPFAVELRQPARDLLRMGRMMADADLDALPYLAIGIAWRVRAHPVASLGDHPALPHHSGSGEPNATISNPVARDVHAKGAFGAIFPLLSGEK